MAYRSTERTEARRAETRRRITFAARELISEGGYVAAQEVMLMTTAIATVLSEGRAFQLRTALESGPKGPRLRSGPTCRW